MPLAAVVDDKFFCVHGGISPDLHTIDDIDKAGHSFSGLHAWSNHWSRYIGLPSLLLVAYFVTYSGLTQHQQGTSYYPDHLHLSRILSEVAPTTSGAFTLSYRPSFMLNSTSHQAATKFLRDNNLLSIIRGHEAQEDGCAYHSCVLAKNLIPWLDTPCQKRPKLVIQP